MKNRIPPAASIWRSDAIPCCFSCWSTATSCPRTASASMAVSSRDPNTWVAGDVRAQPDAQLDGGRHGPKARVDLARERGLDLRRVGDVVVAAGSAVGDAAHQRRVVVGAEPERARLNAVLEGARRAVGQVLGARCLRRWRGRPRGASRGAPLRRRRPAREPRRIRGRGPPRCWCRRRPAPRGCARAPGRAADRWGRPRR